jgi:class 3 adenylate cyclase/tetratricopeptide (TPR) repeat protein
VASIYKERSRITDPLVLSRYLPDSVVQHLLEPTTTPDIDLGLHVARLQDLLQHIVSYVPEFANAAYRTPTARLGALDRVQGTLLAADLSGFTAFSARLSTLGAEGAELVAGTISALFSTLMAALGDWGGHLLKLSGDALTALFSGPDHAHCAVAAALELQRRMEAFQSLVTPAGIFTLRMRIGLASGEVLLAQLGAPERVELLVAGSAARRVMELQRRAEPGAVVIGGATYREIAPAARVVTLAANLYRVLEIAAPALPAPAGSTGWLPRRDLAWELHALIARIEALRPYLVDQHLSRMAGGPPTLASEGDLRPITVLFAALSDAGGLLESATASAEDQALTRVQAAAQQLWEIVARHGGTVNKLDLHPHGHTLIVLFGAPIAHGRDAERAVSCAQALLRAGVAQNESGAPLRVRQIGLATGRVFAGAVGSAERREYTVMGSVVNLAARLMDIADEGQALIDAATAQVVGRHFRLEEQPPVLVKGYDEPVPFYTLGNEQRSRLASLVQAAEPLIGRSADLARARRAVERGLAGEGAVVALVGEAGIGKSRLLAEIARTSLIGRALGPALAVAQAQPYYRVQPYTLIADVLRQVYALPERAEDAAWLLCEQARQDTPEHERFLPLLPTLFGLHAEESALTQALTPDERRDRLQNLAAALLLAHTRAAPTALVLEDLHWADAASLEILEAVAGGANGLPLLLLCTYRPEGGPVWPDTWVETIELGPLSPAQSEELIGAWLGPRTLADRLRAAVVERTQGNPFFIEETARALRERGPVVDSEPPLPTTIQGALLARLDRLPLEERYVLQIASVVGPLFELPLLGDITGDQVALGRALERLAARGLVRESGDDRYAFAHSLTQETIYESLLFAQRRQLHRTIGDRLAGDAERADANPGVLAHHYRRAEAWPEAMAYAWQAGTRAQALYAGDIALHHYQQALEAANHLSTPAATKRRPAILRRIGDLHCLAGRYADAVAAYSAALSASDGDGERAEVLICWAEVCEEQAAYDEALALLQQADGYPAASEPALASRIAVRRGWVLTRRGSDDEARAAVEPFLEQMEAAQQWKELLLAYKVFFNIALSQSRWMEARSYLRLALASAEQTGDIRETARLHNNLGIVLTQEGDLRAAAEACARAAQVMREIGDQSTLASVEVNIGAIYYKIGDFAAALHHYEASLRIATTIGAPPVESIVRSNLGELYRRLGRLDESLDQLMQSVELCQQMQDDLGLAEAERQLAETYIALDRLADAEESCARALEWSLAAGDAQAEAIVYRVRGLLAAARGDDEMALDQTQRSVQMLTELGSTQELAHSLALQARAWLHAGRADMARATIEEAIVLFQKAGAVADLEQAGLLRDAIYTDALDTKVER